MDPHDPKHPFPGSRPAEGTSTASADGDPDLGQREYEEFLSELTPPDPPPELIEQPSALEVEAMTRQALDFTNGSMTVTVVDFLPLASWPDVVMQAVLHSANIASGSSIEIVARAAMRDSDSQQTYVGAGDLASITFDSTSTVNTLQIQALPPASFGSGIRIEARGTRGFIAPDCVATLSVLLVVRAMAPTPAEAVVTLSAYDDAGSSRRYIRFYTTGYDTGIGSSANYAAWVPPRGGRLREVRVRTTGSAGSTSVCFHLNGDSSVASTREVVESITANVTAVFDFRNKDTRFSAGDRLSVSVDPTSAPTDVNVTCIWELDP